MTSKSSGTGSSGLCMFLACFQSSDTLSAHFVELRVFAGVYPFASSSKFSSLENWKRLFGRWGCFAFDELDTSGRGAGGCCNNDSYDV